MKNLYYVIDEKGKVYEPNVYLAQGNVDPEFRILVEREALGIRANADGSQSQSIAVAKALGFNWEPNADIGFMQYGHKAQLIMEIIERYARQLVQDIGFPIYEVRGSNFFNMDYPVVEAYAKLFGERLFQYNSGEKSFVMSYDASYPQFNLAGSYQIRENQLPFAHFSIADCYRFEQSGECMLLLRQRRFHMPDLHPYFANVAQAFEWYPRIESQILAAGEAIYRKYWNVIKVSSERYFKEYQNEIVLIAKRRACPALVEIRRDNVDRYWIVDVDYSIIDSQQQVREIGCIQIDVGNASRLGISFKNELGAKQPPVIIHAAVPGGIERYIYAMLDDAKSHFPFWARPVQVRLIPLNAGYIQDCQKFVAMFPLLRIEIDDREGSVSKRIRKAYAEYVAEYVVIGEKEREDEQLVLQKLAALQKSCEKYPFYRAAIPVEMSKQIE